MILVANPKLCVEEKNLDDEVYQAIDMVLKKKKIYQVTNRSYSVNDINELNTFIDECIIDCNYLLESTYKKGEIVLKQFNSLSYVVIKSKLIEGTDNKYWEIEIIEPKAISTI